MMKLPLWAQAAIALAIFAAGGLTGWQVRSWKADHEAVKVLTRTVVVERKVREVVDHVVTRYVERAAQTRTIYQTITKEVPVYVTPETDRLFPLPNGFVRLHDAAAQRSLPGPPALTDGEASGIAASAAATVIASNYEACYANREQLEALQQAWLAAVAASK